MIRIENLEVRFDVEGDDDRATFARLFREHIARWAEESDSRRKRETEAARERSLLGSSPQEAR
jgi:hypothetical protein